MGPPLCGSKLPAPRGHRHCDLEEVLRQRRKEDCARHVRDQQGQAASWLDSGGQGQQASPEADARP
eukprot:3214529-Rhodomonas_salina.5